MTNTYDAIPLHEIDDPELGDLPLSDAHLIETWVAAYADDARAHRIGRRWVPSRTACVAVVRQVLELLFPGYWGRAEIDHANLRAHLAQRLRALRAGLTRQIELALRHQQEDPNAPTDASDPTDWSAIAQRISEAFLSDFAALRAVVVADVQAAFEGDPAARDLHEVILTYPGVLAVVVHRVAHRLHTLGVPLVPRIMSEWAHTQSGADIHPGAVIGERFFIDHATGVVIGETTVIGDRVKLYQGVTLGALSRPYDPGARRDGRRHPKVEDDVTIYANATVLGGETVIGAGSVIAAGAFVTSSVPAGAFVDGAVR